MASRQLHLEDNTDTENSYSQGINVQDIQKLKSASIHTVQGVKGMSRRNMCKIKVSVLAIRNLVVRNANTRLAMLRTIGSL